MARQEPNDRRCDVALLVDAETGERNQYARFSLDRGSMEERVCTALRARYRLVTVVPFGPDIVATLTELQKLKPRIVFNLTEWFANDRKFDQTIAGLLEMMGLRFTGTGQLGMQLCRDKWLSKRIVAANGIEVPHCFALDRHEVIPARDLRFPMIVKPQFGDASEGIAKNSLVSNPSELRKRITLMRARSKEPLICEEFIGGRDLFVALLGNGPRILPPTEMLIGRKRDTAPQFTTYRLKHHGHYRTKWRVTYRVADLPPHTMRRLAEQCMKIFRALKLRDYARLDFRLNSDGRFVFIEANPNPDLTPHTLGRKQGFSSIAYERLIPAIVEIARRRYRSRSTT